MTELAKPIETILRAIREEREFRKEFSTVADSIVDKIYSYYTNPNCTCKSNIVDWVNNNVDKTNTLLQKYDANIVAMTGEVAKAIEVAKDATRPTPSNPMANMANNPRAKFGTVININSDATAYSTLIKQAMTEGWMYRGCTIIPDVIEGKEVWRVFFY